MSAPIILWRIRWGEIDRVECTRVTASYVWPANARESSRQSRCSSFWSYHETWEEAHQCMLAQAQRKLEKAQGDYARIKGMKPPAEAQP